MGEKKKGGFINRLIMGSEKSETYARSTLPSNRWGLFWDIVKSRFSKLIIVNLLMLLFLLPVLAILFFRSMYLMGMASEMPFGQNIGIGYPVLPTIQGFEELVNFQTNKFMYMFLPIASLIGSLGVAGGFYIIRNIVWTEGIFVSNDFWRGIKLNYVQIMVTAFVYSLFIWLSQYTLSFSQYMLSINAGGTFWLNASIVCNYIFMIFVTIMTLYMFSICVTYKCKYSQLIKNAFLLTVGLLPQNIFFALLGCIPVILCTFGGIVSQIGLMAFVFVGPVLLSLVWTDYSQWVFDKFINDKVPGAKKNRGIYAKVGKNDSKSLQQYKAQMEKFSSSVLTERPIKPITDEDIKLAELPTTFNRADLMKLQESKKAMFDDNERYIEEHKNDAKYQPETDEEDTSAETDEEEMSADFLKTRKGKKALKERERKQKEQEKAENSDSENK